MLGMYIPEGAPPNLTVSTLFAIEITLAYLVKLNVEFVNVTVKSSATRFVILP
jgi:hypothetical protein